VDEVNIIVNAWEISEPTIVNQLSLQEVPYSVLKALVMKPLEIEHYM